MFNNLGQVVMSKAGCAGGTVPALPSPSKRRRRPSTTISATSWEGGTAGEAVSHLQTAVRLEPRNPRTYHRLGNAFAQLGRFADAESAYKQALLLDPDAAPTHVAIAAVYLELSRPADARKHLNEALALDPADPTARALQSRLDGQR